MSPSGSPGRTHIGVTAAALQSLPFEITLATARQARELGYRSFWTAETVGPEAFASLAAVGGVAPGLSLGTGVLALQLRSPQLVAMGAATLQAQQPDIDVLMGVGISSPVVTGQWHGVPYGDRPLARTREYLTLLRACLDGESVTFDGDFYSCRKFRLGVRLGDHRPKIVLGALNERMLALAGELADGVLLNYLPASAVPWCVAQVRAAEVVAGRPEGSCTVYAYVHVSVTDRDAALPYARRDLFSYAVVDAYARAFERAGFGTEVDAIRAAHAARDRDGAVSAVSDRMADAIDICGDAAHVTKAVAEYVAAGADVPVVMPMPWGEDRAKVVSDTILAAIEAR